MLTTNVFFLTALSYYGTFYFLFIMPIILFLVSHYNFVFVPCGGLSWLPVSFILYVKYTLSYRIISLKDTEIVTMEY